jgi:hypothetical protein
MARRPPVEFGEEGVSGGVQARFLKLVLLNELLFLQSVSLNEASQ